MTDYAAAQDALLHDPSLQTAFTKAIVKADPLRDTEALFHFGHGLYWPLMIGLGLVVVIILAQTVRGQIGRRRPEAVLATAEAAIVIPASALMDADALAAAERYSEAVHALLLRGVGVIQEHFPRALRSGHTSREIAALAVLPGALREAFGGIAAYVERAIFARRALGVAEWEACRSLYAGLVARP